MKTGSLRLASLLVLILLLFPVQQVFARPTDVNRISVVSFQGEPQFHEPVIRNAGDVTLRLEVGFGWEFPADFGGGRMCYHTTDDRTGCLRNLWVEVGVDTYEWTQYIPSYVDRLWFEDTGDTPITWFGWGPWEAKPSWFEKDTVTPVSAFVDDVLYRPWIGVGDPTWAWPLQVTPDWQSLPGPFTIKVHTNCTGNNHGGKFEWQISPLRDITYFGNGVERQYVVEAEKALTWTIAGPDGSVFWTGITEGPWCWDESMTPRVTSVEPSTGVNPEDIITVTGNFAVSPTQKFVALDYYNSVFPRPQCEILSWGDTEITCRLPGSDELYPQGNWRLYVGYQNPESLYSNWSALFQVKEPSVIYLPLVVRSW